MQKTGTSQTGKVNLFQTYIVSHPQKAQSSTIPEGANIVDKYNKFFRKYGFWEVAGSFLSCRAAAAAKLAPIAYDQNTSTSTISNLLFVFVPKIIGCLNVFLFF
jgi:hypothetical protein